ncbi:MAG TPA: DUF488 family protein [Xanthobacteraceae bacterium]|nr:DUF488 family protein [Xanthobacteraceae bacterium]
MTKGGARTSRPKRRSSSIAIKRAYDNPMPQDGVRILIDRLWPRGVSKTKLKLDAWPRELAPSTELRKWYGHDPARFAEFRRRYKAELAERPEQLSVLRAMVKGRAATLLTATRELDLSHAEVMRSILQRKGTAR